MTLALYGKSRRRQGALITAALLAVIIATVGALGAITPGGATPGGDTPGGDTLRATTKDVTVPANATNITVGEAANRPAGWNGDAQDYPKISGPDNSDTYTVTNRLQPITVTVTVKFQKVICKSLGDVAKNQQGTNPSSDDIGKPSISATGGLSGQLNQTAAPAGDNDPVTPLNDGRNSTNCHI